MNRRRHPTPQHQCSQFHMSFRFGDTIGSFVVFRFGWISVTIAWLTIKKRDSNTQSVETCFFSGFFFGTISSVFYVCHCSECAPAHVCDCINVSLKFKRIPYNLNKSGQPIDRGRMRRKISNHKEEMETENRRKKNIGNFAVVDCRRRRETFASFGRAIASCEILVYSYDV